MAHSMFTSVEATEPKYVFILFGPSSSGKTSTGNLLLGRQILTEYEKSKCVAAEAPIDDNRQELIRVIDTISTPEYSSDKDGILETNSEVTRSLLMSPSGHRNIVLVVRKDQKPKQVAGCLQFMKILLGEDSFEDLIVTFTGTSEVSDAAYKVFTNKLNDYPDEKVILKKCKHRFAFNDGDTEQTNVQKVRNILAIAKKTNTGPKEVQLVLIGESWAGKTKAANNILGEEVLQSGTETHDILAVKRKVNRSDVMIADTPGFFNKKLPNDSLISLLMDPVYNLSARTRVFVLVMRMDRQELTDREKEIIAIIQDKFKEKIKKKLIIIFTRQEEYTRKGKSFEEFLRSAAPELKTLLKQCHYRVVGFNNMALEDGDRKKNTNQVSVLLKLVNKADADDRKLRIVLLGRTGMGKSSTGNTILGERGVFEHKASTTSTTKKCQKAERDILGREVEVVDTPGLFDTNPEITTAETLLEMAKCLTMTIPGPHAFLLVLAITEKFTKESKDCIKMIETAFGEEIFSHTVLVFTKADHLDGQQTTEEVIATSPPGIRRILDQNNNRWMAINNKNPTGNEPEELIDIVEVMLACHEGRHYTSNIYNQITKRLQAYGAGNIAEMRQVADKHPLALLSIVWFLTGVGMFGFGWVYALFMYAFVLFTIIYESIMGDRPQNH